MQATCFATGKPSDRRSQTRYDLVRDRPAPSPQALRSAQTSRLFSVCLDRVCLHCRFCQSGKTSSKASRRRYRRPAGHPENARLRDPRLMIVDDCFSVTSPDQELPPYQAGNPGLPGQFFCQFHVQPTADDELMRLFCRPFHQPGPRFKPIRPGPRSQLKGTTPPKRCRNR
jgi:hypothetical protein